MMELNATDGMVAPRHRWVEDAAALGVVLDPAVNLCVWKRPVDEALGRWASEACALGAWRVQDTLEGRQPDAAALVAGLPSGALRDALQADIEGLARRFAALLDAPAVSASFGLVDHDMCRKFHADFVGIRLLVTYDGPGTEWVPEPALRREGASLPQRITVLDPAAVQSLQPGQVGLLKGDAWPGNRGHGAVHRSPPVSERGLRRVLLKLDPAPRHAGCASGC